MRAARIDLFGQDLPLLPCLRFLLSQDGSPTLQPSPPMSSLLLLDRHFIKDLSQVSELSFTMGQAASDIVQPLL